MKKDIREAFIYIFLSVLAKKLVNFFSLFGHIYMWIRVASSPKYNWSHIRQFYENVAVVEDQKGNVEQAFFYNDIMLKNYSQNLFGFPDETLSSVYGKNKRDNTLTKFGSFWAKLLNKIDKNHVEKSIEEDEGSSKSK